MKLFAAAFAVVALSVTVLSQTSAFTYQGKLSDAGVPASGTYDLTFKLYTAETGGTQVPPSNGDVVKDDVQVTTGIFTVSLDFGQSPFTGATQAYFLEIWVRPGAQTGAYTQLTPRQPITSSPYAIQTIRAQSAGLADNASQLGGINASSYVKTDDARLADSRTPTSGSSDYIQNRTIVSTIQAGTSFNIDGSGKLGGQLKADSVTVGSGAPGAGSSGRLSADVVQSNNGYIIETTTMLRSTAANTSVFVGRLAGNSNTASSNSFLGFGAGQSSTGSSNSFFGSDSGKVTSANENAFFGNESGILNTSGTDNAFVGFRAGNANTTGSNNTFIGRQTGQLNSIGSNNSFFGSNSGIANSSGSNNTFVGSLSSPSIGDLQNATAIGANAVVAQSNSLVLGNAANVGIGTSAPKTKLHVAGGSVYIANPNSLIITSPNGNCWFITVSDTGILSSFNVACP